MHLKKLFIGMAIILFVTPSFLLFGISDREYLSSRSAAAILPVDSLIGKTVAKDSSELVARTFDLFSQPWSLQWVQDNVQQDARPLFTGTWDKVLAQSLPMMALLVSVNSDSAMEKMVSVRSMDSMQAFSVIWQFSEADGKWYIISLSEISR